MGMEWEFNLGFDRLREEQHARGDEAVLAGMSFMHGMVDPMVPERDGDLRGSADVGNGYVDGATVGEHDHVAHIFFPGPYALYQHEGIYFRRPATYGNPLTHEHGESFYLSIPMLVYAEPTIDIVRERLGL